MIQPQFLIWLIREYDPHLYFGPYPDQDTAEAAMKDIPARAGKPFIMPLHNPADLQQVCDAGERYGE